MGGRAWVMVAAIGATGCAGGAADSRGDGASQPAMTTSGDTSTGVGEAGTSSGESSGDASVPTTSDEPTGSTSTSTSSSGGESSSGESEGSTGAPACGDGQLGADEVCDDGNPVDGDGCNVDCQPSGRLLWSDSYAGGKLLADEALDCAVDEFGAIYVAGFTTLTKPNEDVWSRSWAPDGAVLWTQTYDGTLGAKDRGQAIVVDASQLVYVAGHENVELQSNDVWVRKHAADGTPTWTHGYDGPASASDAAYGAALTAEGDLLVVGAHSVAGQGQDIWLRKLDGSGAVLWTRTHAGAAGLGDVGRGLSVGAGGYIYVVGDEGVTAEGSNMWVGKYDPDGNLLWSRLYAGAAGLDDNLYAAAATTDGGVVVCGIERSVAVPVLSFVRKYDGDGLIVWTVIDDGTGDVGASCYDVDIADNGDVLVAGSTVDVTVTRPRIQRLDEAGDERWSTTIMGAGTGASQVRCVRPAPDGTIVAAGGLDDGVDGRDVWVGRLSP